VGLRAGLDRCGKSRPTGIRFPDRPARRQSLYRLSYRAYSSSNLISWNINLFFEATNFSKLFASALTRKKNKFRGLHLKPNTSTILASLSLFSFYIDHFWRTSGEYLETSQKVIHLAPAIRNVSNLSFLDFLLLFYSASYMSVCLSVCLSQSSTVYSHLKVLLFQSLHTPSTVCCLHFSHQIPCFQMAGDASADRPRPRRRPFCEVETRRRQQVWTDLKYATGWQQQCPALRAPSSAPMTRRDTRYDTAPSHEARRCWSHWRSRAVYCWTNCQLLSLHTSTNVPNSGITNCRSPLKCRACCMCHRRSGRSQVL